MLTPRRALFQVALSVVVVGVLALTSPRPARTQDGRAVPADVRVVNPNTAPVFSSIVNTASAPVQAKIVNALGAPVPANIINPATAPVQARIVNGPASPVQTSLVGSPVVGARQNGAWSVNVTNPSASPARTRDAGDTGRIFSEGTAVSILDGEADGTAFIPFAVAATERVLIEHVSAQFVVPSAQALIDFRLQTAMRQGSTPYGFLNDFHLPMQASEAGHSYYAMGQPTHLYHDPNAGNLSISVQRLVTSDTVTGHVYVQGRVIVVP